jgi:hypothetical protein
MNLVGGYRVGGVFKIVNNIFHANSVGRGVGQRLSHRKSTDILENVNLCCWIDKFMECGMDGTNGTNETNGTDGLEA